MDAEEQFSHLASLIGEPARSKILWNLLDGRAFTATELALMAGIPPAAGEDAGLLQLVDRGIEIEARWQGEGFRRVGADGTFGGG